jgi:iron(III) transport system substrate-binding protein
VSYAVALCAFLALLVPARARAQGPIEGALILQTPVSRFVVDAALKAFADYAKEKWGVTVKTSAQFAGTPVSYARIVEWKGKPEADIFWGANRRCSTSSPRNTSWSGTEFRRRSSTPSRRGSASPNRSRSRTRTGTGSGSRSITLEPYGLVYHPRMIRRLGVPEPKDWEDLLHPKLKGYVAQCAPTRSSSSHATSEIILQSQGEQAGWEWLKRLAGNSGLFAARSRDVPSVVAEGNSRPVSPCRPTWPSRRCSPASTSGSSRRRTPS